MHGLQRFFSRPIEDLLICTLKAHDISLGVTRNRRTASWTTDMSPETSSKEGVYHQGLSRQTKEIPSLIKVFVNRFC
ncbi:hypothetical protein CEXT_493681 [Caerostris extrusa]|uniref:Maturase K n=1 Tax=Caerostris extrusa TaxID=172846 RepID=A0AAV4PGL5_CAEEX|nr:hypothetical protein CEXT_493681 [Caerostris extrusa]